MKGKVRRILHIYVRSMTEKEGKKKDDSNTLSSLDSGTPWKLGNLTGKG